MHHNIIELNAINMKNEKPAKPINQSRLSERILQRELTAINKQIYRFRYNGGGKNMYQDYKETIQKMESIARELEKDLEFLKNYRAYLTREVEEIETFRFDV
jgi:hypothetical protein